MARDVSFDERIDDLYDRWKDGEAPDYSPMFLQDTDCANCNHDWHKGMKCPRCPCEDFRLR